jgi:uncharacterized membrane protein YecN with MAPEG domain
MPLPATALYAALLGLLFTMLTLQVFRARMRSKVMIGTGQDRLLERAVRAHGNFAEFVPLVLVLVALSEAMGLAAWAVHGLGAALLVARVCHAAGISREPDVAALRGIGAGLTLTVLAVAAATLLGLTLAGFGGMG